MEHKQRLKYIEVKEKLLNGEILNEEAGKRLPPRSVLIARYGVTRTTIERAISELIGEGYLYSRIGSGTYVSERKNVETHRDLNGIMSWGVIIPNILEEIYPGILRGIEDITSMHGINAIVCNSDGLEEKQNKYISQLIDSGIKGLIIIPSYISTNLISAFQQLADANIPYVFCNRIVLGVKAPLVSSNSFFGGYVATRHLIETGRKKIAFISVPLYQISFERFAGYKSALAEAGIEDCPEYHIFSDEFMGDKVGYDSTKKLLAMENIPDAIFCLTDMIAKGAYDAIIEANLTVGKEVAVIGYDNTDICDLLPVKLSSVKFRQYEIGRKSAQTLFDLTHSKKKADFTIELFQPELVIRESTQKVE